MFPDQHLTPDLLPADVFFSISHQDLVQLGSELKLTSAHGCGDIPSSLEHDQL